MDSSSTARTDATIQEIGARQYGVVARWQLLETGLSGREVQYRLEAGRLRRVHRGVYAVGAVTGEYHAEMAAVLACGDRCHLSHRSAAALWGLLARSAQGAVGGTVAVTTVRDIRPNDPGIRVHRVTGLYTDEVTVRDGLPVTTPARTLLDLAGCVGARDLEQALARALRERLVNRDGIQRLLDRYLRRRGRGRLLGLLALDTGPAFLRSEAERVLLELVLSVDLPRPETNAVVCGYEVDCLWRPEHLVVEVDGRRYHDHDPAFEADRDRTTALTAAGYRVMHVTWKQMAENSGKVLTRLSAALARGQG